MECNTYFVELDNIWVANDLENVDFSSNPLYIRLVFDFVLFQDLDGYFFTRNQMSSQSYFAEGSLSQRTAYENKKNDGLLCDQL